MIAATKAETIAGKLIAVEGLDGSGKSTQVYLLKRWLELDGYKVFFTEWNSSAIVRKATRKGKKRQRTYTYKRENPRALRRTPDIDGKSNQSEAKKQQFPEVS